MHRNITSNTSLTLQLPYYSSTRNQNAYSNICELGVPGQQIRQQVTGHHRRLSALVAIKNRRQAVCPVVAAVLAVLGPRAVELGNAQTAVLRSNPRSQRLEA